MPKRYAATIGRAPGLESLEARRLLAVAPVEDAAGVATAAVSGRHVFYNHCAYDGRDPDAGAADDGAVAPDKTALRPGGRAANEHFTSYSRGINGVMVDVAGLPAGGGIDSGDFDFRVGRSDDSGGWAVAPAPAGVTVRRGAGSAGGDRVTLVWPDGAIRNTWLRVTVLANADTGLPSPDVFYLGNLVGEAFNAPADGAVGGFELRWTRYSQARPSSVAGRYDFNRDGRVNVLDLAIVRRNYGNRLPLVTPPDLGVWQTGPAAPVALA